MAELRKQWASVPPGGGSSQAVIRFPFYNRVLLDPKPQACVGRLGLWRACPPKPHSHWEICALFSPGG